MFLFIHVQYQFIHNTELESIFIAFAVDNTSKMVMQFTMHLMSCTELEKKCIYSLKKYIKMYIEAALKKLID